MPDDVVLGAARRFHYSNLGFGLLGELVARLRGDVVGGRRHRARCWRRSGMTRTTPRPVQPAAAEGRAVHPWADVVLPEPEHHAGVMAAAGQLWATLADLGRFGAFLLGDTGDVLDPGHARGDDRAGRGGLLRAGLVGLRARRAGAARRRAHAGRPRRLDARASSPASSSTGTSRPARSRWPTRPRASTPLVFGLLADLRAAEPRVVEAWTPSPSPGAARPASASGSGGRRPTSCARSAAGCCTSGRCPAATAGPAASRRADDGAWVGLDGYFAGETLRIAEDHLDLDTFIFTRTPYDPEAPVPGGVDEARLALSSSVRPDG